MKFEVKFTGTSLSLSAGSVKVWMLYASREQLLQTGAAYQGAVEELGGVWAPTVNCIMTLTAVRSAALRLDSFLHHLSLFVSEPAIALLPSAQRPRQHVQNERHFMHKNGALLMRALELHSYTGWQKWRTCFVFCFDVLRISRASLCPVSVSVWQVTLQGSGVSSTARRSCWCWHIISLKTPRLFSAEGAFMDPTDVLMDKEILMKWTGNLLYFG